MSALRPLRRQLDSGAVVIARRNSVTPAVTFLLSFDAGSAFDPPDRPGLAAFVARTIDRGTPELSAGAVAEEVERRGASIDVMSNRQSLTVTCTCLVEDFDEMLSLAARIASAPAFPPDQIELRRGETLTRLVQDAENTGARATARFFERLYGAAHPYAHPPRGHAGTIAALTIDDIRSFHRARVRPGLLTAAIVGDIDEAAACDRLARAVADWREPASVPAGSLPDPEPPAARDFTFVEISGRSQADIAYGMLGPGRLDPGYYPFWVMNTVLGQYGMGGRLGENIREKQGMAYYAYSSYDAHRIPGPLLVRAGVDPANVERTLAAIDFEVGRIAASGITAEERVNAVRYLTGSIPRMLETNAGIAQFLVSAEQFGLGEDFDERLPALLSGVTADQASAAAATLEPSRAVVVVAGPAAP
ncbi:MAG: insulinase family protein [Acidobacteriota bacterium]|nr:insulinase family protein [Acidobacteriota bacterium]